MEKYTVNGVDVIEDGDVTHFIIPDDIEESKSKNNREEDEKPKSLMQKLKGWFFRHNLRPYVKVRDLSDPFGDRSDIDAGSDGIKAFEGGLRFDF